MKPGLSSSGLPALESVDRVRLIRRSMRCFVYGWLGAVPLFGLGMACLTLRLWRELAQETGDLPPLARGEMVAIAVVAFVLAVVFLCCDLPVLVLVMGVLLSALQGYGWFLQYQRAAPRQWNPARHLLYGGAALAGAGLVLSSTIILLCLQSAARWLRG